MFREKKIYKILVQWIYWKRNQKFIFNARKVWELLTKLYLCPMYVWPLALADIYFQNDPEVFSFHPTKKYSHQTFKSWIFIFHNSTLSNWNCLKHSDDSIDNEQKLTNYRYARMKLQIQNITISLMWGD